MVWTLLTEEFLSSIPAAEFPLLRSLMAIVYVLVCVNMFMLMLCWCAGYVGLSLRSVCINIFILILCICGV